MGIFDIFGNKKSDKEAEDEREELLKEKKEQGIEKVKEAHKDLEWPVIQRLNPVNINSAEGEKMDETIPPERKDEIGELIYEEDISADTLKFLSVQELLFLLTTLEVFHKKSALPGYENNHRKVYNEVLSRVRDAEFLYVLYDKTSGFPFLDHGYANVYLEEELASKAAEMYGRQFRNLEARKCQVEGNENKNGKKIVFFDFLYYIGIENLIIDNGAYRARFKRNEIVAAPGEWTEENKKTNPLNPALNFAMIDFLEEVRWPVKYEKRNDVLKAKEMRMLGIIRASHFIVPMQHEGPAEVMEDGRIKFNKDTKVKFLVLKTKDEKQFLPIYTDGFQFSRLPQAKEWDAGVFGYQDILRIVQDKDGISINPEGQNLVMPKDRMMALEVAAQKAAELSGNNKMAKPVQKSADNAVQDALNQAMKKMKEDENNQ